MNKNYVNLQKTHNFTLATLDTLAIEILEPTQ